MVNNNKHLQYNFVTIGDKTEWAVSVTDFLHLSNELFIVLQNYGSVTMN